MQLCPGDWEANPGCSAKVAWLLQLVFGACPCGGGRQFLYLVYSESMWMALEILAGVSLVVFWHRRNAVWGGLTLGLIVGIIWALVARQGWEILLQTTSVAVLAGAAFEILSSPKR